MALTARAVRRDAVPIVLSLLAALLLSWSAAQPATNEVLVGVIASRTGEARVAGASQSLAATGWHDAARAAGGVFGVHVAVRALDDAGSPARAADLARELAADGAWAVVCCTTSAATAAVADVAEEQGLLHLALADPAPGSFGVAEVGYWSFGLWPTETDALSAIVADALTSGRHTAALFTTDDELGDSAKETLDALLGYAGMRLVHAERFGAGADELRPEALLVATSQPGAVVVWASGPDTATAVRALRARGYEGIVYARSVLFAPGGQRPPGAVFDGVRFALPPAFAADDLPEVYACGAAVASVAERTSQLYGGVTDLPAAAGVVDALDLLAASVEQLFMLQLPLESPLAVLRQALRDAAVGLGPRCGASGVVDLQEGRRSAVVPGSLVAAEVGPSGGLRLP